MHCQGLHWCVCGVCVFVCEGEREREREQGWEYVHVCERETMESAWAYISVYSPPPTTLHQKCPHSSHAQFITQPFVVGERVALRDASGPLVRGYVESIAPMFTSIRGDDLMLVAVPNKTVRV